MIRGMTGYGNAIISSDKMKGLFEIKTQNHRYLDIVFFLPSGFSAIEDKLRQAISKQIHRGRVSVSLKITEKTSQKISINENIIAAYLKQAKTLKRKFSLENNLALADLIRLPGVISCQEISLEAERMWGQIDKAGQKALHSVVQMRTREGKSLASDVTSIIKKMFLQVKKIQVRARVILQEKKKLLNLEEFSSFQKSSDINEELTRLSHYLDEFRLLIGAAKGVGKKMDFIAQEMQRETNTIGSKLQDKVVSNAVIALKSKVEKLRELAQNVE